jgi:Amt family ammonium transporter
MQAGFTLVEAGTFKIKKHWKYNNEKLDGLCIGTIGFWAIGYTIHVRRFHQLFIGNPTLFFDSVKDMHSLFFSNCICCNCSYNSLVLLLKEQNFHHLIFL